MTGSDDPGPADQAGPALVDVAPGEGVPHPERHLQHTLQPHKANIRYLLTPHLPGPAALHCPGAVDDPSSPPPGQPRARRLLLVHQRLATDLLQGLVKVFRSSFSHFVFWKSGVFFAFRIRNILLTRVTVNLIIVRTAFLSTDPIFSFDLVLSEKKFTLTLSKGSMCIF